MQRLAEEDPTFQIRYDEDTGQTLISGMGELHLEVLVDRMLREFKVGRQRRQAARGLSRDDHQVRPAPRGALFASREGAASMDTLYSRSSRASGARDSSLARRWWGALCLGSIMRRLKRAYREAMESGPVAGYPVVDLKVTLVDGSYHEVDSSALAFEIAGSMALKEALQQAGPVLLEPVMQVEVVTPETSHRRGVERPQRAGRPGVGHGIGSGPRAPARWPAARHLRRVADY